jgi:hypothetical protein
MKRETGYYWIKYRGSMTIAFYTAFDAWLIPGYNESRYDNEMDWIDEEKLVPPTIH